MKNATITSTGGGIGFAGLLTILFIALKFIGIIDWKWIWVLAPLWIGASIGIILPIILFLVFLIFLINS